MLCGLHCISPLKTGITYFTSLAVADITSFEAMIWILTTSGARLDLPAKSANKTAEPEQSVWDLAKRKSEGVIAALRHEWTPRTHHKVSRSLKLAIKWYEKQRIIRIGPNLIFAAFCSWHIDKIGVYLLI